MPDPKPRSRSDACGSRSVVPRFYGYALAMNIAKACVVITVLGWVHMGSAAVAADGLPRMTRLAEGVYVYEQLDPTKRGVTVNNLVVVTSDGVLVADGQGTVDN